MNKNIAIPIDLENVKLIFSKKIDFLSEIESIVKKFVIGKEYEGVFLKPKYGDASGVRGAARLGREAVYWRFT